MVFGVDQRKGANAACDVGGLGRMAAYASSAGISPNPPLASAQFPASAVPMKIASVECLPVHAGWRKNFVFLRIETDSGLVGWGEAYSQYDRDRAIAAQVEVLGRYLTGRDPFQIRHILQMAFDDYAQRRGSLEFYCATSGIEQALWDIVGKATNQPVYNLLGGPVRDKIRVYANGWSYRMQLPDDYARGAEAVLKRGFSALKFDPIPGPWRTYIPKDHIRRAVKVTRAVRDAVGPEVDILIEV